MALADRPCLRCGQSVYPSTRMFHRETFAPSWYDTATGDRHDCPGIDWSAPYWADQAHAIESAPVKPQGPAPQARPPASLAIPRAESNGLVDV